jgi:hypothetical protein
MPGDTLSHSLHPAPHFDDYDYYTRIRPLTKQLRQEKATGLGQLFFWQSISVCLACERAKRYEPMFPWGCRSASRSLGLLVEAGLRIEEA